MKDAEQRMRLERPALQLGVVLHADEPRVVGVLDRLRQQPVRRQPGKAQARRLEPLAVPGVDLVAVAVALGDVRRAVDPRRCGCPRRARPDRRRAAWCRRDRRPAGAAPARCRASTRSSGRRPARAWAPNSVELASLMPTRLRAASRHAICMPKQMPKYGTLRSRANLAARILPSEPRSPKPPGTRMPLTPSR